MSDGGEQLPPMPEVSLVVGVIAQDGNVNVGKEIPGNHTGRTGDGNMLNLDALIGAMDTTVDPADTAGTAVTDVIVAEVSTADSSTALDGSVVIASQEPSDGQSELERSILPEVRRQLMRESVFCLLCLLLFYYYD